MLLNLRCAYAQSHTTRNKIMFEIRHCLLINNFASMSLLRIWLLVVAGYLGSGWFKAGRQDGNFRRQLRLQRYRWYMAISGSSKNNNDDIDLAVVLNDNVIPDISPCRILLIKNLNTPFDRQFQFSLSLPTFFNVRCWSLVCVLRVEKQCVVRIK